MSALNDDLGGMLNVLVDVPRAMSPLEAREFLITGVFPDLSVAPPESGASESLRPLSDTEARLWLGMLTASTDALHAHQWLSQRHESVPVPETGNTVQTSTNDEPSRSSESLESETPVVGQPAKVEAK